MQGDTFLELLFTGLFLGNTNLVAVSKGLFFFFFFLNNFGEGLTAP